METNSTDISNIVMSEIKEEGEDVDISTALVNTDDVKVEVKNEEEALVPTTAIDDGCEYEYVWNYQSEPEFKIEDERVEGEEQQEEGNSSDMNDDQTTELNSSDDEYHYNSLSSTTTATVANSKDDNETCGTGGKKKPRKKSMVKCFNRAQMRHKTHPRQSQLLKRTEPHRPKKDGPIVMCSVAKCPNTYHYGSEVEAHIRKNERPSKTPKIFRCDENNCNKTFPTAQRLIEHKKTTCNKFRCPFYPECKDEFKYEGSLSIHVKHVHIGKASALLPPSKTTKARTSSIAIPRTPIITTTSTTTTTTVENITRESESSSSKQCSTTTTRTESQNQNQINQTEVESQPIESEASNSSNASSTAHRSYYNPFRREYCCSCRKVYRKKESMDKHLNMYKTDQSRG